MEGIVSEDTVTSAFLVCYTLGKDIGEDTVEQSTSL